MSFLADIRFVRIYLLVGVAAVVSRYWEQSRYDYWAIALYAATGAIVGGLRLPRGERRPWLLLAAGVTLFVAGDIARDVLDKLGTVPPSPNVSDGFYLVAYPSVAIGLLMISRRVASGMQITVDALIVAVAVVAALWPYLFATLLHASRVPLGARLTVGMYPCWDIVFVALTVRIVATRGMHTRRALLLVASVAFLLTGDVFWFKSVDTYALGQWMDYAWLLGYIGLAGAILHPTPLARGEGEDVHTVRRYALLALPVAVVPAILVAEEFAGRSASGVDGLLMSGLLLLVLGRAGMLLRGLERTRAELREQNRLKDELISVVSHDLRTPLTSIMGYLELALGEDTDTDTAREFLEVVKRNTSRLHRLVEDLLFVSRVQAGREALDLEPVDMAVLAGQTVETARPMAESAGVRLGCVVTSDELVLADAHRLTEVLENLLSNAVKFTPPGGRVDVWVGHVGETLVVRVSDTGVGIAEEDCRHLFDRFFRATGAEGVPGAGLGLSIVKAIVEAHGGKVAVQSVVGAGTTFEVRLPIVHATEASAAPEAVAA